MEFQIVCTGSDMNQYLDKLNKFNLKTKKRYEKDIFGGRKLIEYTDYFIILNNLQDLINLIKQVGHEIIINNGGLEIYDDYRE